MTVHGHRAHDVDRAVGDLPFRILTLITSTNVISPLGADTSARMSGLYTARVRWGSGRAVVCSGRWLVSHIEICIYRVYLY
jgi:hypothetical protein